MSDVVRVTVLLCCLAAASPLGAQVVVSGAVSAEVRAFPQPPGLAGQDALAAQPAITAESRLQAAGLLKRLTVTFSPYYRYDTVDRARSIFDVRELKLTASGRRWRIKAGYDVEFWGVMEVVNPVNIINQTDVTEDFLGKRKLGLPMLNYTVLGKFGTVDLYALTGFQPMRFPTVAARLTPPLPVRRNETAYGSGNGRSQVEGAVRYFKNVGNVYVGLSQFYGYSREPDMRVGLDHRIGPFLAPTYDLMHQTGVELQATFANMIVKSEDVLRLDAAGKRSSEAISVGGEYDVSAAIQTTWTVDVFAEYYYDSRAQSLIIPFRNDIFAGTRIALNDRRSTELRVWSNYDLTAGRATAIMFDAGARLSERVKAVVAYRGVVGSQDSFTSIARDSHLLLKLDAFF